MFGLSGALSNVGLSVFRKITDLWKGSRSDSLIDYTQVARVEPIVLIDTDCLYLDSLPDIQQSILSIFAGYYLQAVAISTSVGKIEVMRHLDKLNPRRSPTDSAADSMGWLLAQESYKHALPTFEKKLEIESIGLEAAYSSWLTKDEIHNLEYLFAEKEDERKDKDSIRKDEELEIKHRAADTADRDTVRKDEELQLKYGAADANEKQFREKMTAEYVSAGHARGMAEKKAKESAERFKFDKERYGEEKALANLRYKLEKDGLKLRKQERNDRLKASETGFGRDTMKDLRELANLSVGKQFSVEITDGLHKASIMVSIRLMASSLPSRNLIHILSIGSKDTSAKERYHSWKAGRLEFVKDLIFCQDLIDAHRKNLMADKDGIYTNILKRASANKISTILSANPSVATASNICILSRASADQLEIETNLKLSDANSRAKIFKSTYLMLLCIVDPEWERVTIYSRGLRDAMELSAKDIKNVNKNSGPDVSEILKAFSLGNSPSL